MLRKPDACPSGFFLVNAEIVPRAQNALDGLLGLINQISQAGS
jgi:hypothetical protein